MPLHSFRNAAKYTDIVRLVNVKHQEDIELGADEKLMKIRQMTHDGEYVGMDNAWVVLHVRKYLYDFKRDNHE